MEKIKFKVQVNPFKKIAIISTHINKKLFTMSMYYENIDEWNSFELDGITFDIHFHYDAKFLVSIYPVKNNKVDYTKQYSVNLSFKMTD